MYYILDKENFTVHGEVFDNCQDALKVLVETYECNGNFTIVYELSLAIVIHERGRDIAAVKINE